MKRCRTLARALDIRAGEIVAFVGGGGKTGTMLRLVRELRADGRRVLVSTTTRVGRSITSALSVFDASGRAWREELAEALEAEGALFLATGTSADGKLRGVRSRAFDHRLAALADVVLIEADGSRQMPIKAPAAHEPVVPPTATLVVPMVGLDALGRFARPGLVHRPRLLRSVTGLDVVTPEAVARLLTSARGALKGAPAGARLRPILNKVSPASRRPAAWIAEAVLEDGPASLDRVIVADIASSKFGYFERREGHQPGRD
jgi:molybdenum cofactor cytidylyltransferase